MSRIGRMPITVPAGVQVAVKGTDVNVKGPKGELQRVFSPLMGIALENGQITVTRRSDLAPERALHGTTRAVINNMILGVSAGFTTVLEWDGVGYRAELSGKTLTLHMGYSHPISVEPPTGISFEVDAKARQIKVMGYDKEVVGQVAADIRKVRPVEPYLGKGLHYLGEKIRRKAGKSGKGKK
ncbi:MAG: 50S ribosomal protein L6 [Anaerolineae bacterium CG_4_9_14_3_um_filter_57_17]|nr:50S ribosomal protein L6 [bacterium]NCT20905.1 50S ribosomal protein L6 [bacterium]OIO85029.1 MAG: 50S ribosomal protein L6 [Anaerolineae bacterium CG2_30_57_67]PJB68054.1 MAG: 50S ribosomal protein L6 [Anaerolineae bacterium CG_4_9_14_3_um_filter_57_17]